MNISYDYYRIFYYVAKYENITQAAKALVNNQPNLTRAIKTLESELGCPLFIRNNRGMKLTPEGDRLFAHVRIAFENIEAGEAEIAESKSLKKGVVYVAASEIALHCVLLPVLRRYREMYPGIKLKISNHSTAQAVDAIKNGIADIAVVTTPTFCPATTEEITVRKFREAVVCGSGFEELKKRRVSFDELLGYPLISLGPQTRSYELYSRFCAEEGLEYQPEIETSTADQILPMVKMGLGIGFVAREFLRDVDGVFEVDTEKPLPEREVRILKRREQPLGRAEKALEKLIMQYSETGSFN